jgi:hypothetical protein
MDERHADFKGNPAVIFELPRTLSSFGESLNMVRSLPHTDRRVKRAGLERVFLATSAGSRRRS